MENNAGIVRGLRPSGVFSSDTGFPMKANFINALLLALWPTRHGAGVRVQLGSKDRPAGEPVRYRNT